MPLRDHFRPPISKHSSWEGFHGFWPAAMVMTLVDHLPAGYVAEPRAHLAVTIRRFNLYSDLLALVGSSDPLLPRHPLPFMPPPAVRSEQNEAAESTFGPTSWLLGRGCLPCPSG